MQDSSDASMALSEDVAKPSVQIVVSEKPLSIECSTGKHRAPVDRPMGQFANADDLSQGLRLLVSSLQTMANDMNDDEPVVTDDIVRLSNCVTSALCSSLSAAAEVVYSLHSPLSHDLVLVA